MGGCIITAKGATEAECERKLDEEIEKARELGLEDIRCRVIVELDDGWHGEAYVHSRKEKHGDI